MTSPFLFFVFSTPSTHCWMPVPVIYTLLPLQTPFSASLFESLWIGLLLSSVGISLWWWKYRHRLPSPQKGPNGRTDEGHLSLNSRPSSESQSSSKVGLGELKQLLEGLPHGAILMNADSRIILANPQSICLLKLTTDQLQGKDSFSLNVHWDRPIAH